MTFGISYEYEEQAYTNTPVIMEAINVPKIANVMMAPKLEKNGF